MSLERTPWPLALRFADVRNIVTGVPTASAHHSRSRLPRAARTGWAWLRNLSTGLGGHFNVAQAVLPRMLEQGAGSVVTIASVYRRSFGSVLGKNLYRPCRTPNATRERAKSIVISYKNYSS